jgi:hypothetical protein
MECASRRLWTRGAALRRCIWLATDPHAVGHRAGGACQPRHLSGPRTAWRRAEPAGTRPPCPPVRRGSAPQLRARTALRPRDRFVPALVFHRHGPLRQPDRRRLYSRPVGTRSRPARSPDHVQPGQGRCEHLVPGFAKPKQDCFYNSICLLRPESRGGYAARSQPAIRPAHPAQPAGKPQRLGDAEEGPRDLAQDILGRSDRRLRAAGNPARRACRTIPSSMR